MADIVDKKTRSRMMSGIRSNNTKPEIVVRSALHRLGYRYKLNKKIGKITPDVVLSKDRVAVFIHGCFWHQHKGCKLAYSDRNYSEKWQEKFRKNKSRDERVVQHLIEHDWRVAVVWECVTRDVVEFEKMMVKLYRWIKSGDMKYFESDFRKL
ncbi:DNA mismatch endonuclease Vsr [Thiohalophilus sp.]|uniref:very short patch repair endonuclease n=1 Tax=Thiohalophilus sp. TaxID=3028392 RepID=UPI002ACDA106|nr:DNA mismatch endonuclease Vsr [Thiohalophilus sp.]MDZ7803623.1 DNA mismatch endonuclease Vsr [Thiohalophilus sp.]